jgi:phosphoribosylformylglycinamidine (FGAM) synthase-like amidotransferase family enzyme
MAIIYILKGKGIECENESKRALELAGFKCEFWPLPQLLSNPKSFTSKLQAQDWVFLPGGFSFADHLGSGKLLAYELREINFFEQVFSQKASLWGICNGFQVLCAAGLFGKTRLEHNRKSTENINLNFIDRWVELQVPSLKLDFQCPVRHGEGRLVIDNLPEKCAAFMYYSETPFNKDFDNGSEKKIAALIRKHQESLIIGMMPHPEILLSAAQHPNYHFSETPLTQMQPSLFKQIIGEKHEKFCPHQLL